MTTDSTDATRASGTTRAREEDRAVVRVGAATPRWAIGADNRTVVDAIIVEIEVWGACGGDRVRARESADGRGRVVRQGGSARRGRGDTRRVSYCKGCTSIWV